MSSSSHTLLPKHPIPASFSHSVSVSVSGSVSALSHITPGTLPRPLGPTVTATPTTTTTTRTRSFGGCFTCRSRKVKCDETHPLCTQCRRSGLQCEGYQAKIRFIMYVPTGTAGVPVADQAGHDGGHGRRILFTETHRLCMSEQLKAAVRPHDLDRVLASLDRASPFPLPSEAGPFSVFACSAEVEEDVEEVEDEAEPEAQTAEEEEAEEIEPYRPFSPALSITSSLLSALDPLVQVEAQPHSQSYPPLQSTPNTPNTLILPSPLQTSLMSHASFNSTLGSSIIWHSHFLLEHYKSQMGKLFSPLRARKPPWSVLHFPRALSALSEISVFRELNHAHTSLFYAVLAVSAFNWDNINRRRSISPPSSPSSTGHSPLAPASSPSHPPSSSTYWREVGDSFRLGAKRELELAGEVELVGEKSAKYKDILMAILTMVTISVVTGQQDEARAFLLNAELFICVRGVSKPRKSRKVKLLHCIYLFLRVVEESTYAYPLERTPLATLSQPLADMRFPSLRTNSLCVGRDVDAQCGGGNFEHGLFGDMDAGGAGAAEAGLDAGFFVEIYGIPHELLSFISRATFLANEIQIRREVPDEDMTFDLDEECRLLEEAICGWDGGGQSQEKAWEKAPGTQAQDTTYGFQSSESQPQNKNHPSENNKEKDPLSSFASQNIMPHLIRAFHSAVIIFFYRRVRHVHPLVLQPWVEKTIGDLEAFEEKQRSFALVNCGVVWPGFIAGAEALDSQLQARFLRKLCDNASVSGMWNFGRAAAVLRRFWRARSERGSMYTWMEYVRENKTCLVLT